MERVSEITRTTKAKLCFPLHFSMYFFIHFRENSVCPWYLRRNIPRFRSAFKRSLGWSRWSPWMATSKTGTRMYCCFLSQHFKTTIMLNSAPKEDQIIKLFATRHHPIIIPENQSRRISFEQQRSGNHSACRTRVLASWLDGFTSNSWRARSSFVRSSVHEFRIDEFDSNRKSSDSEWKAIYDGFIGF